jgi:hypothetical protein
MGKKVKRAPLVTLLHPVPTRWDNGCTYMRAFERPALLSALIAGRADSPTLVEDPKGDNRDAPLSIPPLSLNPALRSTCRGQGPPKPLYLCCERTDDGDGRWRMTRGGWGSVLAETGV